MQKANKVWKARLAEYETPAMDEGQYEELTEYVDRRKAEGGVKTDF